METSTLLTIIGTVAGTLFSEKILLFAWARWFPTKLDETQSVAEVAKLGKQIEDIVTRQLNDAKQIIKLEAEKSGLELELKIKQSMIDDYKEDIKTFFKEVGASEEREKRCQKDLREALARIEVLEKGI